MKIISIQSRNRMNSKFKQVISAEALCHKNFTFYKKADLNKNRKINVNAIQTVFGVWLTLMIFHHVYLNKSLDPMTMVFYRQSRSLNSLSTTTTNHRNHPPTNNFRLNSDGADGGPRSLVCVRLTLRSAPHRH